jgi:hypothetical protein
MSCASYRRFATARGETRHVSGQAPARTHLASARTRDGLLVVVNATDRSIDWRGPRHDRWWSNHDGRWRWQLRWGSDILRYRLRRSHQRPQQLRRLCACLPSRQYLCWRGVRLSRGLHQLRRAVSGCQHRRQQLWDLRQRLQRGPRLRRGSLHLSGGTRALQRRLPEYAGRRRQLRSLWQRMCGRPGVFARGVRIRMRRGAHQMRSQLCRPADEPGQLRCVRVRVRGRSDLSGGRLQLRCGSNTVRWPVHQYGHGPVELRWMRHNVFGRSELRCRRLHLSRRTAALQWTMHGRKPNRRILSHR